MASEASAAPAQSSNSVPRKRSVFALIAEIPTLVTDLVQREIELVKTEIVAKLKALGVGVGVLLTAAIFALSQVMSGWLAALLVAAVLLIIAGILGLIGYRILKKGIPPFPSESIDSLRRDLRAIKGIGKRGTS